MSYQDFCKENGITILNENWTVPGLGTGIIFEDL